MGSCDPRLVIASTLRSRHGHNQQNECQLYTGNNHRDRSPIRDEGPKIHIHDSRRDVDEDGLSKNQEQYRDYRSMPVLPTVDELIGKRDYLKLQANIVNGSYDNWNHYLCVQFFY